MSMLQRRWMSTPFEPVEVVGQRRSQFDDPAVERLAQQIQLDLGARRDVLVERQHHDPAGRDVPLELGDQIVDVDIRLAGHDVLITTQDRPSRSWYPFWRNQSMVNAAWRAPPSIEALATITRPDTVDSTPRAAGWNSPAPQSASTRL